MISKTLLTFLSLAVTTDASMFLRGAATRRNLVDDEQANAALLWNFVLVLCTTALLIVLLAHIVLQRKRTNSRARQFLVYLLGRNDIPKRFKLSDKRLPIPEQMVIMQKIWNQETMASSEIREFTEGSEQFFFRLERVMGCFEHHFKGDLDEFHYAVLLLNGKDNDFSDYFRCHGSKHEDCLCPHKGVPYPMPPPPSSRKSRSFKKGLKKRKSRKKASKRFELVETEETNAIPEQTETLIMEDDEGEEEEEEQDDEEEEEEEEEKMIPVKTRMRASAGLKGKKKSKTKASYLVKDEDDEDDDDDEE
jgi:hypothetical protein